MAAGPSATIQRFPAVFALFRADLNQRSCASQLLRLGTAARRLDQAVARLESAIYHHGAASQSHANDAIHGAGRQASDTGFLQHTDQLMKDVRFVLVDCEIVLSDINPPENPTQHLSDSVLQELTALLGRIIEQTQKLLLFLAELEPVAHNIDIHRGSSAATAQLLAPQVINSGSASIQLPESIEHKFRQAASREAPSGFGSPEEFSIRLGLDALAYHLQQSTTQAAPGIPQTIHQYLSLLKMQWMVRCLEQLPAYRGLDLIDRQKKDVVWYRTTVLSELRRGDLSRWRDEDVINLPDHFYTIWPPKRAADRIHNPMQARDGEKQILTLSLASRGRDNGYILRVLRLLKNATGTAVRVVRKGADCDPEDMLVDTFKDNLFPLYAFRSSRWNTYGLAIRKADYQEGPYYEFANTSDLYKLQRSLTCYSVASDFESVDWAIARSFLKSTHGEAIRLHIWLWDPDDSLSQTASEATSGTDVDSRQSIVSQLTAQSALTILHNAGTPHISVSSKDRKKFSSTEVVEAVMPYEPLLIMYTQYEGKNCYLALELDSQVIIDPTTCTCSKKPEKCNRVVLKNRKGDLQLTRVLPKAGDRDGIPDLGCFARSFRKGQAAHPALLDNHTVERLQAGHIALDFRTVELRKTFNRHFSLAYKLRSSIESADQILETRARFLADKPEGNDSPRQRIVGVSQSQSLREISSLSKSSIDGGSTGGRKRSSFSDYAENGSRSSRSSSLLMENALLNSGPPIIAPISELADRNVLSPAELHSQSLPVQPTSFSPIRRRVRSTDSHEDQPSSFSSHANEILPSSFPGVVSPLLSPKPLALRRRPLAGRGVDTAVGPASVGIGDGGNMNQTPRLDVHELP